MLEQLGKNAFSIMDMASSQSKGPKYADMRIGSQGTKGDGASCQSPAAVAGMAI